MISPFLQKLFTHRRVSRLGVDLIHNMVGCALRLSTPLPALMYVSSLLTQIAPLADNRLSTLHGSLPCWRDEKVACLCRDAGASVFARKSDLAMAF